MHETALASPEVVDLGGRVVVPGLTDAHVHFPTWALAQTEVTLDGCSSLDEALARIRAAPSPAVGALAAWPRLAERRLAAGGRADRDTISTRSPARRRRR